MKLFKLAAGVALALSVTACADINSALVTGSGVSSQIIEYDQSTLVTLHEGFLERTSDAYDFGGLRLSILWTDKAKDASSITISRSASSGFGGDSFKNIEGLEFNIDGEFVSLRPLGAMSDHNVGSYNPYAGTETSSSRSFYADLDLIRRLDTANSVLVKVTYLDRTYSTRDFKKPSQIFKTANAMLPEFLQKVDEALSPPSQNTPTAE